MYFADLGDLAFVCHLWNDPIARDLVLVAAVCYVQLTARCTELLVHCLPSVWYCALCILSISVAACVTMLQHKTLGTLQNRITCVLCREIEFMPSYATC